jgi:hypothetical protein
MPVARVSLAAKLESRTNNRNKDSRIINGMIETKGNERQVVKRPGTRSLYSIFPTAPIVLAPGRGIFAWDGSILAASGNYLSYMSSPISTGSILGTITGNGPVSFLSTAGGAYAALQDGASIYTVSKATKTLVAPSGAVQNVSIDNSGTNGYYGPDTPCTVTSGATTTITKVGHGLVNGQGIEFGATSMPSGLAANTTYQVRYVDANTFTVNTVSTGTGVGVAVATGSAGTSVVYRASPTVTFSAGAPTATGTAKLFNHQVVDVIITGAGTYTVPPSVTFSAPTTGATATASGTLLNTGINGVEESGRTIRKTYNISTVSLLTAGASYVTPPTVTVFVTGGIIKSMPTILAVLTSTGTVDSFRVTYAGEIWGTDYIYPATAPAAPVLSLVVEPPQNNLGGITALGTVGMASSGITGPFAYGFEYLDGYCFIMKTDGSIYQATNLDDPTVWNAANVIRAESEPDTGVALAKHLNYLVAFGAWSTDVFYNAGNPTGSTLNVNKSAKLEIGCASGYSVAKAEQTVLWLGQSKTKGRGVYLLEGLSPIKVSTRYVDNYLNASDLSVVYSYCFKVSGHTLYVLTLVDQQTTLVYDLEEKEWYLWKSNPSNYFYLACFGTTLFQGGNSYTLVQDDQLGQLLEINKDIYSDDQWGSTVYMELNIVTPILDSGTNKRKFFRRVEVIGDRLAATLSIRHYDDDYQTGSSSRTVDMSISRPVLYQNGSARRRAYMVSTTDNAPIRLDALEIEFDIGGQE